MPLNPFEAEASGTFHVLVNSEDQYSLWPSWVEIPSGWKSVAEGSRGDCLAHIESRWTDMRPAALANAQNG
ncbi:MbtH family protein [Streptomyces lavendulae]|nr:MbtH family NRPS accessory protein [Streptomyces lavendulae]